MKPAAILPFSSQTRTTVETSPVARVEAPVEAQAVEAELPAAPRTKDSSVREALQLFQSQPRDRQLREQLFDRVKSEESTTEALIPRGSGGKGGIFSAESKDNAQRALSQEPVPEPSHGYVKEKAAIRRRLDQLGLAKPGADRIFVHDVDQAHGEQVTRTLAGKTALIPGADVTTDAPRGDAYLERKKQVWRETANPLGQQNPSVGDFVKADVQNFPYLVASSAAPITSARKQVAALNDGNKTFMNMSHGATPDMTANQIAARMMLAGKGTVLHDETVAALGREPRMIDVAGGRKKLDADDMVKLKKDVIYPKMKAEMETPEYQAEMRRSRAYLEDEVKLARDAGIMVFEAAMNDHESADRAGDPMMSQTLTAGTKGILRVGATKQNQAGTADDEIAAFSGAGPVTLSASGTAIPVAVDADGRSRDVEGTSFATPIATETAYAMSAANPKLSLDQIERLLTDPRVVRDIPGTTRDGAGVVDQFAAVLLAKDPSLTARQIEEVRRRLDADPNARFDLGRRGVLTSTRS